MGNENYSNSETESPTAEVARFIWYVAFVFSLVLVLVLGAAAIAEEGGSDGSTERATWSSFRGGGSSRVSSDAVLPAAWSPGNGISWQVELPGYGQSSPPLVVEDKVLVTAVEGAQKEKNLVVCIDRDSGETLWRYDLPTSLHPTLCIRGRLQRRLRIVRERLPFLNLVIWSPLI